MSQVLAEARSAKKTWARERTFIMIKPDGVQRGLVGEVIKRFEARGFRLVALKFRIASRRILENHYEALQDKPFFPKLMKYMRSGPVVPLVFEGRNVVTTARKMLGVTNPADAPKGTIRGDFGMTTGRNVVHGSDSVSSARREISLWFKSKELEEII